MSHLSLSIHSGALIICFCCTPYAKVKRSVRVVLNVLKWLPCTLKALPGLSGSLGLMVATSKLGSASAAIGGSVGGGVGMVHAVSGVARSNNRGSGFGPCVHWPAIDLPSADILPS